MAKNTNAIMTPQIASLCTAIAMYHWELGNVDTMYLEKCKVITTCYNCHQFYIASIPRL